MKTTRRGFIQAGGLAGAMTVMPNLIPARVLGQAAPSKLIRVGIVGLGRVATTMEISGIIGLPDLARITAICDVDSKRLAFARERIERDYKKRLKVEAYPLKTYGDYRDMLRDNEVDAVMIASPDHWHALCGVDCAIARKDIWMQKPFAQTIHEGRILAELVRRNNLVLQVGSQQRSDRQFRTGCELVRNGRVGRIQRVEVGFGRDNDGGRKEEMPIPPTLDYDRWLGPTPEVYYTEDRVHNQDTARIESRPGWIQLEPYGWGMITNWGTHHLDIAQWGLGTEERGPLEISGTNGWLTKGLWNVHAEFDILYKYPGGIEVSVRNTHPNGVRFIGDEGWIFVSRGATRVTASDPAMPATSLKALDASDARLLETPLSGDAVRLHVSNNHVRDWIEAIRGRTAPVTTAEIGHRSTTVCLLGHMCMKTGKTLRWDDRAERTDNEEANRMMACFERGPYSIARTLQAANIPWPLAT